MRSNRGASCMGMEKGVHRVLVGKPEGKRLVGDDGWDDNIKQDVEGVGRKE